MRQQLRSTSRPSCNGTKRQAGKHTWLCGITPCWWCNPGEGWEDDLLNWINEAAARRSGGGGRGGRLRRGDAHGGYHVPPAAAGVETFWLATVAHRACYQAPGGTQISATIGDRGDPQLGVFCLTAGFVNSAGTSSLATDCWRVRRVQARFSEKYEARPRCVGIRGRCVYLWTAPAAVRGRKSAAAHWRDAICSFCCSASSRAERHANNSALCWRDARYCTTLRRALSFFFFYY